jgi:8-oxo-dGTP pyrophosphatase MutT (NUDIX family)
MKYTGTIGIIFIRKNGPKYLLVLNRSSKNVSFTGGMRKSIDRSLIANVRREIYEESGLRPDQYIIHKTDLVHEFIYGAHKKAYTGSLAKNKVYIIETSATKFKTIDTSMKTLGYHKKKDVLKMITFIDLKKIFLKADEYIRKELM